MKNVQIKISIFLLLVSILGLSACKSKKKNTAIKRAYHNVTAHYNGYFNAKMRIDQVAKANDLQFIDQYDQLLPIYKMLNETGTKTPAKGSKSANQPLDEAIKKASFVIQRHEISKWIDDCYLEIGRAYFYKKDYFTAIESFQYVAGKYKLKPSGNRAYIWLIRSYVQLNKMQQAESVINVALASETIPKNQYADLFVSIANYYVNKNNYAKAIEYLEKALVTEKKKNNIIRYNFIIAQLYERTNNTEEASAQYQKVVSLNPPYEMAFNARINRARLFQSKSSASRKEIEKGLLKMLKDDKNRDFKDQIYYSLANIYENNNNEDKALEYYLLSATNCVTNVSQKGLSFLKVANIYYEEKAYQLAQIYYDSTGIFLDKNHQEYELVQKRKTSLTKLVTFLNTINKEDSLQRIARMPEAERLKLIDKIIKKEKDDKRKKEQENELLKESLLNNPNKSTDNSNPSQPGAGSTWYFYNPSAVTIGYSEFLKRYGRRSLEDNWRRANKESFASITNIEPENTNTESKDNEGKKDELNQERKKYLSNLPFTQTQIDNSNSKIVLAYYNIGQFYREDIINTPESIRNFETLLKRYPENTLKAETYYNLYRQYLSVNNNKQAEIYKSKILTEYPNSLFTKVINDPNYTSEADEINKKAQSFYEQIYSNYLGGDYNQVISYKGFMDTAYSSTSIGSKYSYLYALSIAKTKGVDSLEVALNNLVKDFPSSEQATIARETLLKIAIRKNPALAQAKAEEPSPYILENKANYLVAIFTSTKSMLKETKTQTSKFNNKQFSLLNLTVNAELIGEEDQVILISSFADAVKANEYLDALNKQSNEVIKLPKTVYSVAIISENNLKILRDKKDVKKYLQFYQGNYQINE